MISDFYIYYDDGDTDFVSAFLNGAYHSVGGTASDLMKSASISVYDEDIYYCLHLKTSRAILEEMHQLLVKLGKEKLSEAVKNNIAYYDAFQAIIVWSVDYEATSEIIDDVRFYLEESPHNYDMDSIDDLLNNIFDEVYEIEILASRGGTRAGTRLLEYVIYDVAQDTYPIVVMAMDVKNYYKKFDFNFLLSSSNYGFRLPKELKLLYNDFVNDIDKIN